MSDQFIGEIRWFTYLRGAPQGWLLCDGSTHNISQYEALASLLGTVYGGDGSSTFALPDLRGRVPIGASSGYPLGQGTGTETVSLTSAQLPPHNHAIQATLNGPSTADPAGQVFATGPVLYYAGTATTAMASTAIGSTGQGLPHENCAPTLPLQACIAWDGVWPPLNN